MLMRLRRALAQLPGCVQQPSCSEDGSGCGKGRQQERARPERDPAVKIAAVAHEASRSVLLH